VKIGRLIGPNCQGLANFATGMVANFSTIFNELEARDGPVAIVSQSGANSQAIYTLLRDRGLSARHVHATGNEADVTVADLAAAVVADEGVRLVLLYMEAIKDPPRLAAAAAEARRRGVPIVALKAGRTASGQKAASSHTGALATEDRVVDAFFERHGIWRATDPQGLVGAAQLYVDGHRPRGKRLVFVSNSGASCVMAADHAESRAIPLAAVPAEKLKAVLPAFAAVDNPIDVTGALLGNSGLLGAVLPIVGEHGQCDLLLLALPVAGTGYDVPRFAHDIADFQRRYGIASGLAAPQPAVREPFAAAGIATFAAEGEAMDALAQLADHAALLRRPAPPLASITVRGPTRFLNEAESLALLAEAGLPVIEHHLCKDEREVQAAVAALGAKVVMKACSRELPHKSDHGLVAIGVTDPLAEFRRQRERCLALGARFEGVIVARHAGGGRELALGARIDPAFGPLVLVGDGAEVHALAAAGRALDGEPIAVVVVIALEGLDDQIVHREPHRAAPVGVAAEQAGVGLAGRVADLVAAVVDVEVIGLVGVGPRQRADAVGRQKLALVEHVAQDALEPVAAGDREQAVLVPAILLRLHVGDVPRQIAAVIADAKIH
jgi:acyl-CoA synthetase (NDP forming)